MILTGAGRAFSAGGDIAGMQEMVDNPALFDISITEAKKSSSASSIARSRSSAR